MRKKLPNNTQGSGEWSGPYGPLVWSLYFAVTQDECRVEIIRFLIFLITIYTMIAYLKIYKTIPF